MGALVIFQLCPNFTSISDVLLLLTDCIYLKPGTQLYQVLSTLLTDRVIFSYLHCVCKVYSHFTRQETYNGCDSVLVRSWWTLTTRKDTADKSRRGNSGVARGASSCAAWQRIST